ncbi:MAG: hypothetical protein ACAI25_10810 [Planctomycetota bacterium]
MRRTWTAVAVLLAIAAPVLADDKKDEKKAAPANDDASIKKKLAEQKITVNFDGTPFLEVLQSLQELTDLNFVLDTAAHENVESDEVKVTLQEKNAVAKDVLDKVLAKAKLSYEIWRGTVWIATKGNLPGKAPRAKIAAETAKKLEKTVTLNFDGTPLVEVLAFLKDLSGVKFSTDKDLDAEQIVVSLKLKAVKAADVVDILCRLTGLAVESKNGAIVFLPKENAEMEKKK